MYIKRFVKHYYIMLIPALLWLFFFSIVPMFGIVMAFQDYNPGQGILHSKFVGLANFEYMFQMSDIKQVLRNTVVIAVGKIIGNIIIPLVFLSFYTSIVKTAAEGHHQPLSFLLT